MGTNTTKLGLLKPSENDFYNQQTEQADNWEKVDKFADDIQKNVDFNLLATLGIEYGGILNNTNAKVAGKAYYDTTGKKLYKCIVNTSINYADAGYFEAISNNDLLNGINKEKLLYFSFSTGLEVPAHTIHTVALDIPQGYYIDGYTASARVLTENIDQLDYNTVDTPISYSLDPATKVFRFSILVNTQNRGRMVDLMVKIKK